MTRRAAAFLLLLALTACGGSEPNSTKASTSTSPATQPTPRSVFDGQIDVGGGRHLRAVCVGSGSPTVLLESGGGSDLNQWPSSFVTTLAAKTTTCRYSRAGARGSTALSGLMTRAQVASDAYTMLDALHADHGVNGPYVFVGQSFGGSVALIEALEHPDRTAGMVILDTDFPADFVTNCRAAGHSAADCQATYKEDEDAKSLEKEILAVVHPLPNLPISVVSALDLPDCHLQPGATSVTAEIGGTDLTAPTCDALASAIADKMKADWGRLGPQVTSTRIQADHDHLVSDASTQIADLVLQIVTSAR